MGLRHLEWEGLMWTYLAQNRDHLQVLENVVMKLVFRKIRRLPGLSEEASVSREWFCDKVN
jgi:hypothetical protein